MIPGICKAFQGAVLNDLARNAAHQLSDDLDCVVLRSRVHDGVEVRDVPQMHQRAVDPTKHCLPIIGYFASLQRSERVPDSTR